MLELLSGLGMIAATLYATHMLLLSGQYNYKYIEWGLVWPHDVDVCFSRNIIVTVTYKSSRQSSARDIKIVTVALSLLRLIKVPADRSSTSGEFDTLVPPKTHKRYPKYKFLDLLFNVH
jgi:hypothetical protein